MKKSLATVTQEAAQYLSALPPNDARARDIRDSLAALLDALTIKPPSDVPENPYQTPPPPPEGINGMVGELTKMGGSRGSFSERRLVRMQAGYTLAQAAKLAETSIASTTKFEIRRSSIRPDIRKRLDAVYAQFAERGRNVKEV